MARGEWKPEPGRPQRGQGSEACSNCHRPLGRLLLYRVADGWLVCRACSALVVLFNG